MTEPVPFTTLAYGAPAIGSATVSGISRDGATVNLSLDTLGAGSSSATVLVEASANQSLSPVAATASGTVRAQKLYVELGSAFDGLKL